MSPCFSGKESVGDWHPPVVRKYTVDRHKLCEEKKVPSMMIWCA